MSTDELVIDEKNFNQHFFDTRKFGPKPGQVLACYDSFAEFVDGNLKRDILYLLINTTKAEAAQRLLRKVGGAVYKDSIRVVREMTEDLINGLSPAEVADKPYRMQVQFYYYTAPDLVPMNDPHWWSTKLVECKTLNEDVLTKMASNGPTNVNMVEGLLNAKNNSNPA